MKRFWAIHIKRTVISLAVVFAAGAIFNLATAERWDRAPVTVGAIAVAAYLVAGIVLGLLNAISGAVYLSMFGGSDLKESVLDDLRAAKLPAPRSSVPRNFDALASIADDEYAHSVDRVRAAVLHGRYSQAMTTGIFASLAVRRAIDDAMLRYCEEAPQKPGLEEWQVHPISPEDHRAFFEAGVTLPITR